jgi:hypothetical protein
MTVCHFSGAGSFGSIGVDEELAVHDLQGRGVELETLEEHRERRVLLRQVLDPDLRAARALG